MKQSLLLTALCSLLLASCRLSSVNFGDGKKLEPSQQIVKRESVMKPFDKIDVDVVANVKFIQTDTAVFRVVLSCPDNYVDLFRFEVDGGELEVAFTRDNVNIEPANVDITIYAPSLRSLENSGVASVEIDRLRAERLEIDNSGVGSLYLSGLAVGDLEADCSGVGSIELAGSADRVVLDCSGVGSIKAAALKGRVVKADVSGVGGVSCYASERIDGEVSGVGSLSYGGSPCQKQFRRDGVGKISEL